MEYLAAVNVTRPIGIEIECLHPVTERKSRYEIQQAIARVLTANGIRSVARAYSTAPVPSGIVCCVEFDESLVPPAEFQGLLYANLEVKTKKLAGLTEFDNVVPRVLEILRFLNCRVNGTTGLHVSLGVADDLHAYEHFVRSVLNLFFRFERVLYGLVAAQRRDCGYAVSMPDLRQAWCRASYAAIRNALLPVWQKRCGMNLLPLLSPPFRNAERIEFRWLEGTLRLDVLRHWVILLNRFVDHAATHNSKTPVHQVGNNRAGFDKLAVTVGFKPNSGAYPTVSSDLVETRRYLLRRWRMLNHE